MMTEELLKALQLIKEECSKYDGTCKGCAMRKVNGGCGVTDIECFPSDWRLEKREVYF